MSPNKLEKIVIVSRTLSLSVIGWKNRQTHP